MTMTLKALPAARAGNLRLLILTPIRISELHWAWAVAFLLSLFPNSLLAVETDVRCAPAYDRLVDYRDFAEYGALRVHSRIHDSNRLIKEAEFATKDDRVQKELDDLLSREIAMPSDFHMRNLGMGRFALGNGYYELRGSHGGRLFIQRVPRRNYRGEVEGEDIFIVGKATKKGRGNETEVFNAMRAEFSDFPAMKGNVRER